MLQGRYGSSRPDATFGLGSHAPSAMETFDVAQLLALTHQEYAHCSHPKTLHERLSDIGSHGGRL
jgi:hypothetical protein